LFRRGPFRETIRAPFEPVFAGGATRAMALVTERHHMEPHVANAAHQKRIVTTRALAQILGGIGVAAGAAVGALLAADLASESFSGLAAASSVIGAAVIAIPVTRLMT